MGGALAFPHLWDPKTGETNYGTMAIALLVGTPQMFAMDCSTLCHAAVNPYLAQWGLDYMAVPIWLVGASTGLLAHEHTTAAIGGDLEETARAFASLRIVLLVFAACCAGWLVLLLYIRCIFSEGRAAAKEKAYTYWQDLQGQRAKVRADYAASAGAGAGPGVSGTSTESGWIAMALSENDNSEESPTPREDPGTVMSLAETPGESGWIAKKLYENDVSRTTTPRAPDACDSSVPETTAASGWIAETLYDLENSKAAPME